MNTLVVLAAALFLSTPSDDAPQAVPTYPIAGIVVDALTGNPVRHAEVTILGKEEETTTTDADGRFRFPGLEAGKYPFYAGARGYVREGYNQHGAFLTAIAVGPELDSEHIVFRLHPQAVVHGRVTDERGEAVRQALVQLFAANNRSGRHAPSVGAQAQTDDLGEYRFAHLLAGKYYVVVQARPWYAETQFNYTPEPEPAPDTFGVRRPVSGHPRARQEGDPLLDVVYPVTFYPGVTDEHSASEIKLAAGDNQEANIPLRAVPSVHLRVANLPADEKNPVGIGASQRIFGETTAGLPVNSNPISPGEYELAGLPPGEVTLYTVRGGDSAGQTPLSMDASASEGETLDMARTGPVANVSGRIILPVGNGGVDQGSVTLLQEGRPSPTAQLKKDGTFSVSSVQAGTYKLLIGLQGNPWYLQKVSVLGAKASGRELTIDGSRDVQITVLMGQGVGQIKGAALRDGHPADSIMVLLVPESGENVEEDSRMDQSDSDGTFTLGNIVPGKYALMAIQDGWNLDWQNPSVLKPYHEKAELLDIAPGDAKNIKLAVQPTFK